MVLTKRKKERERKMGSRWIVAGMKIPILDTVLTNVLYFFGGYL